jgi:hypothetical protein
MARQTWKACKFAGSQFAAILFHFLIHLKFVECSGINRGIKNATFLFWDIGLFILVPVILEKEKEKEKERR